MSEVKSLKEIVLQLRACGFTCEAGPLENNVDFQLLEEIAGVDVEKQRAIDFYRGKHFRSVGLPTSDISITHPQDIRDEIIETAKRDVTGLSEVVNNIAFSVNQQKRTVVAYSRHKNHPMFASPHGIAKCDTSDCFNVHIGKAIALRRALGLEVPVEYLNAPQPTEARIGDVVQSILSLTKKYRVVESASGADDTQCSVTSVVAKRGKILDDSREEVSE